MKAREGKGMKQELGEIHWYETRLGRGEGRGQEKVCNGRGERRELWRE